ncbi:zinc finger protein basonuclin-2 [Pseudorasbora parva]|uniref:zinc finger protein basonuclin-2 n=1 Tax=Pseudorasbora parva TaxID=51549 RepID=UPI00351F799F
MGTWTHTLLQEADADERTPSVKLKVTGCTHTDCHCECFLPGRRLIRSCDRCDHGWVAHAVGKVCEPALLCSGQVEIVQIKVVFDISSLILFGTQAVPVRMKILLDRLFSVLTHTQVLNIIHTLGWTLRDYVRGYMLQDSMGKVLDHWVSMSPEDEVVTLRQFLRFGETKPIVELMAEEMHRERRGHVESPARERRGHVETPPRVRRDYFETPPRERRTHTQTPPQERRAHTQTLPRERRAHFETPPREGRAHSETPPHFETPPREGWAHSETPPHFETPPRERRGHFETPPFLFPPDPHPAPEHVEQRLRPPAAGSTSKGRVSCDACAKTFYDKGTLKIHFNAVHLKIKHRCTVAGCNMMFSSLRSRNRHSANPNPRLHAALQPARRLRQAPPTPPVSTATGLQKDPAVGGATAAANRNGLCDAIDTVPKKKSRKSSTPLRFEPEIRRQDDDLLAISPRQLLDSLHGNKHHSFSKLLPGRIDWTTGEDGEWKERCRPLLKVKEEMCDPRL